MANELTPVQQQDAKIWTSDKGSDYFIESTNFDPTIGTNYPKGAELIVYSVSSRKAVGYYFASEEGFWINYKPNPEN